MSSPRGEETMAERLEWIRHALGVSQKEFAASIGVSPTVYSNWLRGDSRPTFDSLVSIYHRHSIGPDFLLLGLTGNLTEQWQQRWELRL